MLPTAIKFDSNNGSGGQERRQAFTVGDLTRRIRDEHRWEGMFIGEAKNRRCVHVEFFRDALEKRKKKPGDKKKWIKMADDKKFKARCALCEHMFDVHNLPGRITFNSVRKCREMFRERMAAVDKLPAGMNKPRLFANLYDTAHLCVFCSQFFPLEGDDSSEDEPEPWTSTTPEEELSLEHYRPSDICRRRTSVSWPVWAKITNNASEPTTESVIRKSRGGVTSQHRHGNEAPAPPSRARLTVMLNTVANGAQRCARKEKILDSLEKLALDVSALEDLIAKTAIDNRFPFPEDVAHLKRQKSKRRRKKVAARTAAKRSPKKPSTSPKRRAGFTFRNLKMQPEPKTLRSSTQSCKAANNEIRKKIKRERIKRIRRGVRRDLDDLYSR